MQRARRVAWMLASLVAGIAAWWIASVTFPVSIADPATTASALVEILTQRGPRDHYFYFHLYKTAEMIVIALVASIVLGTALGVVMGRVEAFETAASSLVYAWLAIPSLILVFFGGIWFGFNPTAGYFAVPVVVTPFVTLNMWSGMRSLDRDVDEMSDFFGASRLQKFRDVTFPQLVPYLFASIRSALSIGWKITLLTEAFLLTRGVGYKFKFYFDQFSLAYMAAWIIVFMAFLIVVEYGVVVPIRNHFVSWRPDVEGIRTAE